MPTRKLFSVIEVVMKFNCFSFEVSSSLWSDGNYVFVKDGQKIIITSPLSMYEAFNNGRQGENNRIVI